MQGASIAALVLVWMLLADTAAATAAASTATVSHYAVAGVRPPTALTVAQVGALRLRGGGNTIGGSGEAITEEQAGEELIKAATANNIAGLDPAGLNLLIQSGAPVNYQDMWKRTPLHYAAREGQIEACQRLVELGGDLTAQDILGRTPLHLAARKGHADLVVILANLGSDLDHADRNPWPNNSERTPLHWACYKGRAEVVLRLCELGANKEAVDAMKRTPLHWAARRGQTDCVQVLLVLGANLHAVDSKQMKPVNLANSKESNSATQKMLHQATVRKVLPTGLPSFPPQPVPAVNLHADGSAGIYAQEADAPDMTPAAARRTTRRQVAATTPASTASPDTYAARKAAATAARISAAKAASPGAGHGGGVREPGSGNDDLAAAVARARAQYQAQSPAAGGMGAEDLIDGGNKAAGGWAAEGGNRKFKTAMGEDQDLRYIREDIGVEDSQEYASEPDDGGVESEEIDFA